MKKCIVLLGGCLLAATGLLAQQPLPNSSTLKSRSTLLFDSDWRFIKDSVIDAHDPAFNDRSWRKVELPHDWSIEDLEPQIPGRTSGPFDRNSVGANATGFTVGGTGWYRKKFKLDPATKGKQVSIYFDGVYMVSDVWLNGRHLGTHPYGYTPFFYDLTSSINPAGQENTIAVKVENKGKNSRWYSGSGIYRHVWLTITAPLHIAQWGVYITTPKISGNEATVKIRTKLESLPRSSNNTLIRTSLRSPAGKTVASTQTRADGNEIEQTLRVPAPALWSLEQPQLYTAVVQVLQNNKVIDEQTTAFGIRSLSFSAEQGFLLNSKKILLQGGCIHHDNGPLGSATIDRAEERKIEILKQNGFNAIRTSHNPPSQQLLDACDRLGMLVIDEAFDMWERPKNPNDYHLYFDEWWQKDLSSMLLRDRNHPSVIMWSIGNEINERADSSGLEIERKLIGQVKQLDSTRPVTEAICHFWDHPGRKWDATTPAFAMLDVGGYNYKWDEYRNDHELFPERIMAGTESFPQQAYLNWQFAETYPYVLGDFVWTAFDYMGETAIGHTILNNRKDSFSFGWPWYNAWCGDIDLTGYKKPQSYYRDVVWRRSPIEIAVHQPIPDTLKEVVSQWGWPNEYKSWTWPGQEGKTMQVRVFSRSPIVRLELNGKIIGEKQIPDSSITALFEVPYQPGQLKATAIENGKGTGTVMLRTLSGATGIRLSADRPTIKTNRNDLAYVSVEIADAGGTIDPNADLPIHFTVTGAGELLAVASADPIDMSGFRQPVKKTFRGRCIAILRPTGKAGAIQLRASADGMKPATITIRSTN